MQLKCKLSKMREIKMASVWLLDSSPYYATASDVYENIYVSSYLCLFASMIVTSRSASTMAFIRMLDMQDLSHSIRTLEMKGLPCFRLIYD